MLRKGGSNWVDGEKFFNRTAELEVIDERVRDGIHTLLTAQRRMGKTSLVRELLRRLALEADFETIFVDLEATATAADAILELVVQSRAAQGSWGKIKSIFENFLKGVADRVDAVEVSQLRVELHAGINAGNWQQKGDGVFAALAQNDRQNDRRLVLAIDELPILVDKLLKEGSDHVTPGGKKAAEEFLGWLRKNAQQHKNRISMILSGSVGLEPILQKVDLSAYANVYSPYDLKPWSEHTAAACLGELVS